MITQLLTNKETRHFRDISDGGSCKTDPMTGMPDSNCLYFISTDDNEDVTSSYMAVPFHPSVRLFVICRSLNYYNVDFNSFYPYLSGI